MRGHDGVELAPGPLFDVFGYIHHARFWYPCGKTSRSEIDQHVSFRFSAVRKADEKAITESDVVSADCRTGGRLRHFSVLSDQAATVELGEVRLRTRWWSELRLRPWARPASAPLGAGLAEAFRRRSPFPPLIRASSAAVWYSQVGSRSDI